MHTSEVNRHAIDNSEAHNNAVQSLVKCTLVCIAKYAIVMNHLGLTSFVPFKLQKLGGDGRKHRKDAVIGFFKSSGKSFCVGMGPQKLPDIFETP